MVSDKLRDDEQSAMDPPMTWSTLSSDIALAIHQLNTVAQQGQRHKLMAHTSTVVETIRVMLYASGSMEKDVSQTQDPALREPRRAVMASLSKLVLSAKMASEGTTSSIALLPSSPPALDGSASETVVKVQRDAGDVLSSVRNFVTTCQQCQVQVAHVDPRLIDTPGYFLTGSSSSNSMNNKTMLATMKKLQQQDEMHPNPAITTSSIPTPTTSTGLSTGASPAATMKLSDSGVAMVQKAKYPLNQDLVVSLRTHGNQIYGSTDALSTSVSFLLNLYRTTSKGDQLQQHQQRLLHQNHPVYEDTAEEENGKANVVHLFRSLSAHLSQFLSILEDIDVPVIADVDQELPSLRSYRADKQALYNGVGQLFGTVQQLTDQMNERNLAGQAIDQAIAKVERTIEGILMDVGEMVVQRHAWMVRQEEAGQNKNISSMTTTTTTASVTNTTTTALTPTGTTPIPPVDGLISLGGDLSLSPITPQFFDAPEEQCDEFSTSPSATTMVSGFGDDSRRRGTLASLRKRTKPTSDDRSSHNWFLAPDYQPNELLFGNDNNVKGGTLAALVERLTMHDSFGKEAW